MPTSGRRRHVSQAVWYFLRQDHEARELIVLDDEAGLAQEVVPDDPRIRYVRCAAGTGEGAKRNRGCELASGELVAHWHDGAWYGPGRLRAQVQRLAEAGSAALVLDDLLHYEPRTGRVWRHARRTAAEITLVHRRELWETRPFEDRDPVRGFLRDADVDACAGTQHAVAVLERPGDCGVNELDPSWRPQPFDLLRRTLDLDLAFYARRSRRAPCRVSRVPVPITLAATFMTYDGYGSMAEHLALGLAKAGADVQLAPLRIDPAGCSPELRRMIDRSRPDSSGVVLCHAWWGEDLTRFGGAADLFVKTAWETSRLPGDWPARLNRARAVIVPSQWAARVFRESGVHVPVEVAHEGIDPDVYPYVERPERAGLTTLVVGVLAERKNFRQAVAAWKLAFEGDPDARLILKARFQLQSFDPGDPRILVADRDEATRGILHWYREADVLLALGNEGFGLPLVEGMATGLPVVALDAEAQADVCREADGLVLPVPVARWEPFDVEPYGDCGVRAIPDVEAAARSLRWVAEHRDEARRMGRRASRWAHANRDVRRLGPQTLEAIERHARTPRPLRRRRAFWAPVTGAPPGYRVHAGGLGGALAETSCYQSPPAAWRAGVLHVQHLPALFDEAELTCRIESARAHGVAVVVTVHEPSAEVRPWEARADALVALCDEAAERLRAHRTCARVDVIPSAGPAWREAGHAGGGRTVAVMGEPEDGEREQLLAMQDVNLIAFGAAAARALQDVPGLRAFALAPDAEQVTARLSTEADVVAVLGPDPDAGHLARVAIAAGAPVVVARGARSLEAAGAVLRSASLAEDLSALLEAPAVRARLNERCQATCESSTWERAAAQHHALWHALES